MAESGAEVEIVSEGRRPEASRRRKCVQSKLPWLVNGGRAAAAEAVEDGGREALEESESGCEGSRKKRRRSQAKAPRKTQATGKYASRGSEQSRNSVVSLSKRSNRRLRKQQDGDASACLVQKSTDIAKGTHCQPEITRKRTDSAADADQQNHIQPTFDLWMEAKVAAEENGRLSAGKQTHPFFTCKKSMQKTPDRRQYTKLGSRHWSGHDGDDVAYNPIHVFDELKDDVATLDWRGWIFLEQALPDLNSNCAQTNIPSVFEGSVEPLKLDTVCNNMRLLGQLFDEGKAMSAKPAASAVVEQLLEKSNAVYANDSKSMLSRCGSYTRTVDDKLEDGFVKQSCWLEYCLWTNKYQPQNASEVCGNSESTRFLSEWLKSWHEREKKGKNNVMCKQFTADDSEGSLYRSESEVDDMDDGAFLDNVLLITGPAGTGKSAAVYACAKEQRFDVIEVNASDLRNGALVKLKFGEAMESHRFKKWSAEDPLGLARKHVLECALVSPSNNGVEVKNGSIEKVSRCKHEIRHKEFFLDAMESESAPYQGANKSLILFEDVDIVFEEDRGFISTVLRLAETAKRPIILTSNKKNPDLPHPLDRLVLNFTFPSSVELLSHLEMVCGAEETPVSSCLLKQLISSCLGDIRKILMLLQFWCQGNRSQTDRSMQCAYSPLAFDMDAAHLILPKAIPWEFRCQLSEMVEKEVNSAIYNIEENSELMEIVKQQDIALRGVIDSSELGNNAADPMNDGKNGMLKRNGFFLDCSEYSCPVKDLEEPFGASSSPVKFARRRVKHRPCTVVSSQSDSDSCANDSPDKDSISPDPNGYTMPLISALPLVQTRDLQDHFELASNTVCGFKRDDSVQNQLESSEAASPSHICDTFKMQDLSCVPESSFLSGSETVKDDCQSIPASPDQLSVNLADFIRSVHKLPDANPSALDKTTTESNRYPENSGENSCDIEVESVNGSEENRDLHSEHDPQARGYQVMDECSQANSTLWLLHGKKLKCSLQVDPVQETWRKLRSHREHLKSYFAPSYKDALSAVNYASALTDLISESDVMLGACESFLTDAIEPSRTLCVEPDAFSWDVEQSEMGSTFAQHGLCFYTNKCARMGANLGQGSADLRQEMLGSSTNTMALGKLLTCHHSYAEKAIQANSTERGICLDRELVSELHNGLLSIVPPRLSMSLKGPAFSDYLGVVSQISKLESQRLSQGSKRTRRRRSRALLSDEQVKLFGRSFRFKEGGGS